MQSSERIVQDLLYKKECYQIIGICMKVHSILGKGFKEIVYKDAMEIEFKKANIVYEREKRFSIQYEETILPHKFDADFFAFDSIILEIKAVSELRSDNFKQTLNYLKSSQVKLGLLINFGEDKLIFKRVICSH